MGSRPEEEAALVAPAAAGLLPPPETKATTPRRRVAFAALTAVSVALGVSAALAPDAATRRGGSEMNVVTHCPKTTCYACTNGNPGVPEAYVSGAWGNLTGNWYVFAQNAEQHQIDCDRFSFLDEEKRLHEEQLYYGVPTSTEMWFNVTSERYDDATGMWLNEHSSDRAWSLVWLVGTYKGSRYFGWYHCGDAAGFTKRGEAFVMKDDLHWDDTLLKKVKKKMKKAGLLDAKASTFSEARQTRKSCSYTFKSAGL